MEFFETSGRSLLAAEAAAGVGHHVALSVVGADRLPDSGYMRAKTAQERLIQSANAPYTIVRATQFFEFVGAIADSAVAGEAVRLPPARMQPIAADDVVVALAEVAVGPPANGIIELAGPDSIGMDEVARQLFSTRRDARQVITDPHARSTARSWTIRASRPAITRASARRTLRTGSVAPLPSNASLTYKRTFAK